jgi:hypothetical protein
MNVDNIFNLEDIVYLKTDKDQCERIVTGLRISKYDIIYQLNCGDNESCHYDFEISDEVNVLITSTN